ncbi:UNVERIFIED_CONTAM: hypothetical protein Sradi_7049500 [Sesamum radiatum]|uniref:DUF4283 domain-containing protein n=1 Tax=Sesamum radiatum TaxID=300843 RepID=A0AAW2J9H1_SESRA
MDSPKTLCSLSHTETHNSTHIQTSSQADDGDGEPVPDDELAVHEHIQSTFNMVDFMRLATKVVDEDDRDSMAILEALHKKWQGKFGHKDAPAELRLKPVAEHENATESGVSPPPTLSISKEATAPQVDGADRTGTAGASETNSQPPPTQTVPELFVGNVRIDMINSDPIADAFLKSSRKTLRFISPTKQRDEIIIRPTLRVMEQGSRRWRATAVGYFLGRKPYFHSWKLSNWKGLKHTKIPVWIKFKHLPMEYWTEDGLSAASGVGVPLYADKVTKACSRLDYARVCVMLDYSTVLPKHVVVISPILRDGKEVPTKVDIEYEWLPQKCRKCCSLGHSAANCPEEKRRSSVPITVFVRKEKSTGVDCSKGGDEVASQVDEMAGEVDADGANNGGVARCPYKGDVSLQPTTHPHREDPAKSALPPQADGYGREVQQIHSGKGKEIVIYNSFEVLDRHSGEDEGYSQSHNHLNSGPNSCSPHGVSR